MKLYKKILIGIITAVLVVSISMIAVLAAQSFTYTINSTVGFNIGTNIQCNVWCEFRQFNSASTYTTSTTVSSITAKYASFSASSTTQSPTWTYNTITFSSASNYWMLILYVENTGENKIKVTISQVPAAVTNLTMGSFRSGQVFNKGGTAPGYTFTSITGSGTVIASPDVTGVELTGSAVVGGIGGTVCITRLFNVTSSVSPVSNGAMEWTISLVRVV